MQAIPFRQSQALCFSTFLIEALESSAFPITPQLLQEFYLLDELKKQLSNLENISLNADMPFLKYYGYLVQIEPKFPIYEHQIEIDFTWKPVFSNSSEWLSNYHLHYELASTLFNIGAWYSQLAQSLSLSSEANIRKACEYYQKSAGAFSFLIEQFTSGKLTHFPLEEDFQSNLLLFVTQFMLTQASETTWWMAKLKATLKDTNLAKIASELASLYLKLALKLDSVPSKSESSLLQSWNPFIESKHHYFQLQAELHMAKSCMTKYAFGESIPRWEKALHYVSLLTHLSSKEQSSLKRTIEDQLMKSRKENDLIYLNPLIENLPLIPHANITVSSISLELSPVSFLSNLPSFLDRCLSRFDQTTALIFQTLEQLQSYPLLAHSLSSFVGYSFLFNKWTHLKHVEEEVISTLSTLLHQQDSLVKDLKTKITIASKSNQLVFQELQSKVASSRWLERLQTLFSDFDALYDRCKLQREELKALVTRQSSKDELDLFWREMIDPIFDDPEYPSLPWGPEHLIQLLNDFQRLENQLDRGVKFFNSALSTLEGLKPSATEEEPSLKKKKKSSSNTTNFPLGQWDSNLPLQFKKS